MASNLFRQEMIPDLYALTWCKDTWDEARLEYIHTHTHTHAHVVNTCRFTVERFQVSIKRPENHASLERFT